MGSAFVMGGRVNDLADTTSQTMDEVVNKGRGLIKDTQVIVTETVEAGRTAMQREQQWLSCEKTA